MNTVAPKSAVFILVMELPGTGGPPAGAGAVACGIAHRGKGRAAPAVVSDGGELRELYDRTWEATCALHGPERRSGKRFA